MNCGVPATLPAPGTTRLPLATTRALACQPRGIRSQSQSSNRAPQAAGAWVGARIDRPFWSLNCTVPYVAWQIQGTLRGATSIAAETAMLRGCNGWETDNQNCRLAPCQAKVRATGPAGSSTRITGAGRPTRTGLSTPLGVPPVTAPLTPRVFVSYRRSDSGPYARMLQVRLSHHLPTTPMFMDLDSIEAGSDRPSSGKYGRRKTPARRKG